jgi:outer membrane receptor protein involved in Fe transport
MRINLDYALPFGKGGKLEAGYQYYSYLEDGDYNMEWWDPKGQTFFWRDDIYNTFYFQEGVNSIYTILSHTWKNLEAQAGVRGEHTHTVLRSSVEGADRTKNRFEFFPSVHLGYTFPNEHRLLASYSRRTTRPQLFYMEPYITYRDFYTAEIGNPDIRPEYINSFELNYRKSFGENTVSATAFHRYRKDKIERLRVPYSAGVTLDSMANVGHDYSTGIELSVSLHPVRWWNTTVNGNVYHYKVKNEQAAGGNTTSSTNYDILWNNLFNLGKYTRIQLDGSFVGPSVTTQGRTDAYWYANVAVRQQLCNRKLTATLAFRDIFRSAKYISDIQTADLRSLTRIKPKYPQITLTLSWTFNSFKAKSTQAKEDRSEMFEGIKH